MRLGFGQYKDVLINEVPLQYLTWLVKQEWLYPRTRHEIENVVMLRRNPGIDLRKWERRWAEAKAE
jgi:uncharacterized protein (DUF3820 family)